MKQSASRSKDRLPTSFDELNRLHPLRPINDRIDLKNAYELLDQLALLSKPSKDQNDYLEALILLAKSFEADKINDAIDRTKSTGLDALKYLMDIQGMKQMDIAKILQLGSSAIAMILSGDRPITADHSRKLAKYFSLSPAVFI